MKFSQLEEEIIQGEEVVFTQGESKFGEALLIMTKTQDGKKYIVNQSREYFDELSPLIGNKAKVKIIQTFDDKKYKVKEFSKDGEEKWLTLKLPVANINITYFLKRGKIVNQSVYNREQKEREDQESADDLDSAMVKKLKKEL